MALQTGDRANAPTVLLVHGWEGRGTQLCAFVAPLVAAGKRVAAFDVPAHGDSPGERTNVAKFGRALAAVSRFVDGVGAVIAHPPGVPTTSFANAREGFRPRRPVLLAAPNFLGRALARFSGAIGPFAQAFVLFQE